MDRQWIERMMKTLGAHNRQIEKARVLALVDAGTEKAGVLCDWCGRMETEKREVELVNDGIHEPGETFKFVVCPECLRQSRMDMEHEHPA